MQIKGKLRKLFTNEEILSARGENHSETAENLTKLGRGLITRQLAAYWVRHLEEVRPNGEPYIGTTVLDRAIRNELKLRQPSRDDYGNINDRGYDNSRILIIPDQHAPYQHPDTIQFLKAVKAEYRPTRIINLGDETDGHALSMHDSDPSLDSAGVELTKARMFIKELAELFPVMDICHSNHGSLVYRRAFKSGIPVEYIKSYREILFPEGGGEGWVWSERIDVELPNGEMCLFQHQSTGDILNNAAHERASIVQGHEHGKFEIRYRASTRSLYFGLISGCLIDGSALAFAYGKLFPNKPLIGCSLILDSLPILVPMVLDDNGRWTQEL